MSTKFEEESAEKLKSMQVYRTLGQGITILHPLKSDPKYAEKLQNVEVDIVAVPGLGANPKECWQWKEDGTGAKSNKFNWLSDRDGLPSLFPRSRIMLYDYASAWQGKFKVRATMKSLCTWLLDDLKERRKEAGEITRPLIFIGHSMGGIVIAKSICMAKAKKDYEAIVTCTMGCAFFGSPFRGSDMAKIALLYSNVFGDEAYESLLSLMKTEKNDVLDEVTDDFVEIGHKLVPPIELLCIWEQVATATAYTTRFVPGMLQHAFFKSGARRLMETGLKAFGTSTHFVEKESAVLPGSHSISLTASHTDLIKFRSIDSEKFGTVKPWLEKMVRHAKVNVRRRTMALGQRMFTQKFVNQVRESLEGVDMRQKVRTKIKQRRIASWVTSEQIFQNWKSTGGNVEVKHPCLWLKGGPGLGKTNACLAGIQQVEHDSLQQPQTGDVLAQSETFLAYFLCDSSSGSCTAEDLLKSIVTQIINQEESLAQHAKWFVAAPRFSTTAGQTAQQAEDEMRDSGARATATVDNLWRCFEDMIADPIIGTIHIIINNIHHLEMNQSTNALLTKLREHAVSILEDAPISRRVRWLITSRNDQYISDFLTSTCVSVIDMENDHEHGAKIKAARQRHADEAVVHLRNSKKYSSDLHYYVRSSIHSRSQDDEWIDVLCRMLAAMPDNSSDLSVRKRLQEICDYSVFQLIDDAWKSILKRNVEVNLELEEILHSLVIAYEPPTLLDLADLTQMNNHQQLRELIGNCAPLIEIGDWNEHKDRIIFADAKFGACLSKICYRDAESRRRFHGLMALRCFKFIKRFYETEDRRDSSQQLLAAPEPAIAATATVSADERIIELTNNQEELGSVAQDLSSPKLDRFYPVKYLFRHLSEAPPDAADELFEADPGFWGRTSRLRDQWLADFKSLTPELKELDVDCMSALHVAASIGVTDIVATLIDRSGSQALSWTSSQGITALHVAAYNNHADVVTTLLKAGADIEAGSGVAGTPLHCAALRGHCDIMDKLIERGADVNALSDEHGPVINAAILSGTVEAVKKIMNHDVRFDFDWNQYRAPISLAAGISEPSLFEEILQTGREKWLMNAKLLDQALVKAAYGGRVESLRILLKFEHTYTNNTIEDAVLHAAQENNWSSAKELLEYAHDYDVEDRRNISLDFPFYLATISPQEQLSLLDKIWMFTNQSISQNVIDFSLYEATVLEKDSTALWLLNTCGASANATAQQPCSLEPFLTNIRENYGNPLNAAARIGKLNLVKPLCEKGAIIDGPRGYSLQVAASEGWADVVEYLLKSGADVNKEVIDDQELSFDSVTALQAACDKNREEVVAILLRHGANPNLGGGVSSNPITAATQRPEPAVLKLLLNAKDIDVNVTGGKEGSTPLINAATHMAAECVELLIKKNADVNAKNPAGDTALIMAAFQGKEDSVDLLCSSGADVTHRSPRYGLAVEAAARATSPRAAKVLAENMGTSIASFREKVKLDHRQMNEHEQAIEGLKLDLFQANDRLDTAQKQIEENLLEKASMMSERRAQGSAYISVGEQIKAIKAERDELQKQLDGEKGQNKMIQDTAVDLRERLEEERAKNASLRTRSGFTALEEKKSIINVLEEEKRIWLAKSLQADEERTGLQKQIQELRDELFAQEKAADFARTASVGAMAEAEVERGNIQELQTKLTKLEAEHQELQTKYEAVQAAASSTASASTALNGHTESNGQQELRDAQEELRNALSREGSALSDIQSVAGTAQSVAGSTDSEPPVPTGAGSFSPPLPSSAGSQSPATPVSAGFRTIHGQHRINGAMGGYENGGGTRRKTSETKDNHSETSSKSGKSPQSPGSNRFDNGFASHGNCRTPEEARSPVASPDGRGTQSRFYGRYSVGFPGRRRSTRDGLPKNDNG